MAVDRTITTKIMVDSNQAIQALKNYAAEAKKYGGFIKTSMLSSGNFLELSQAAKKARKDMANVMAGSPLGLPADYDKKFTNVGLTAQKQFAEGWDKAEKKTRLPENFANKFHDANDLLRNAQFMPETGNMKKYKTEWRNNYHEIMKGSKSMTNAARTGGFRDIDEWLKDSTKGLKKHRAAFAGWAMSIMFAGMALQRVSNQVWSNGTKAFQDIAHSVEGTATQFDMLEGSMKFLGFTIGQALEPVAAWLVPIVDHISDLVMENEELVAGFTITSAVLGGLFSVGGMGVLALNGFADLATKIGLAKTNADGIVKMDWGRMAKVASVPVALFMTAKAVEDLKNGDILDGAGNAVFAGGVLTAAYGNKKLGGALVAIGATLQLVDMLIDGGGKIDRKSLAEWMIQVGGMAMFANPAVGLALLTFGITFALIDDEFWFDFLSTMKMVFTLITGIVAIALDGLLLGIRYFIGVIIDFINKAVDLYNSIRPVWADEVTGIDKPEWLEQGGFTKMVIDDIRDQIDEYQIGKGWMVPYGSFTPADYQKFLPPEVPDFSGMTVDEQTKESFQKYKDSGSNAYYFQEGSVNIVSNDWEDFVRQLNLVRS